MRTLFIELYKQKRTGILPLMLAVGCLGAVYAFANFIIRRDTLLRLPLPPMDILLTQVYGMILIMNMFGIIVAACAVYNMEFKGNAVKKMHMLPVGMTAMYLCKLLILTVLLLIVICMESAALAVIGTTFLPKGAFEAPTLVSFAGYSFLTSMPVLTIMILVSSRFENMWLPLGIGVGGFLSGMALAASDKAWFLLHPFVLMLKPAVAMHAQPDPFVVLLSAAETLLFLCVGLWTAKTKQYE